MKALLLSISLGLWALTATLLLNARPAVGAGDCATALDLALYQPVMPTSVSMTCQPLGGGILSCNGSLK